MHAEYLEDAGLTDDQTIIYLTLLQNGSVQASRLAMLSGLKRSHVYKILGQLENLNLVEKDETGSVTRFTPEHPSKLRLLVDKRLETLQQTKHTLEANIDSMISQYNFISSKPNVQFFEGEKGLQRIYNGIISAKKDILLFRSPYDNKYKELSEMIESQIKKQVKNNIKTKAITPVPDKDIRNSFEYDYGRKVERRILKESEFTIPAQIIIYGNKVGITSYRKGIFTTIIDNEDISESFQKIFMHLWDKADMPQKNPSK